LPDQQIQRHPGFRRQVSRFSLGNEPAHIVNALRNDQAELSKMGADRVGKLAQRTDQKIPCPVAHQNRLLDLGLDGHEARSAPLHDPPDRSIRWRGPA
jgi:hypothetical protein